ncbi:efflux RND transporter periplasmic adaptor subunit [Pseudomonas fluvialis]|uniref:efflux RND transporter periplasmic adaptor subunit n=1 Tax=Pseudomonas fluvialis TaxID=1793966 RepID=UPI00370B4001
MPAARSLIVWLLILCTGLAWWLWQVARGSEVAAYRLELRPLVQRVVASGEVGNQSVAQVGSEITGVVAERYVREGDSVQAGQLLLRLQDDEQRARLAEAEAALRQLTDSLRPQAEAALREARHNHAQALREYQRREALRQRQLLSLEQLEQARRIERSLRVALERAELAAAALAPGGSEQQVLEQRLQAARANLAKTRIHAQVAGTVQNRAVEPGDLVQPGRTLLQIARADSREIILPLDEKNIAALALGQPAQVAADAYPEQWLAARVSFIAPNVDSSRGTLDVHLELLEAADFLRYGMTVSVNIETARREQALVLANDALLQRQGRQAQVQRVRDGRVEALSVRLGLQGDSHSEVLDGLAEGDLLLAEPAQVGQQVRVRLLPGLAAEQE